MRIIAPIPVEKFAAASAFWPSIKRPTAVLKFLPMPRQALVKWPRVSHPAQSSAKGTFRFAWNAVITSPIKASACCVSSECIPIKQKHIRLLMLRYEGKHVRLRTERAKLSDRCELAHCSQSLKIICNGRCKISLFENQVILVGLWHDLTRFTFRECQTFFRSIGGNDVPPPAKNKNARALEMVAYLYPSRVPHRGWHWTTHSKIQISDSVLAIKLFYSKTKPLLGSIPISFNGAAQDVAIRQTNQ
jgi:hypothetical protein